MARHPRYRVAGAPQHVIQRGNNRMPTFTDAQDYRFYLECLLSSSERFGCSIHAYVLMTNHVHLLVTPQRSGAISTMMQSIGRRYVRRYNDRTQRTGTLWEGRFRAVPIDSDRHLMVCHRYIEMNPVRAGLASSPASYSWSSFRCNALGRYDPVVTPHDWYLAFGSEHLSRQRAYLALFDQPMDDEALDEIRVPARRPTGGWRQNSGRPISPGRKAPIDSDPIDFGG